MSYEGYERALCANGHLHGWDCYDSPSLRAYVPQHHWENEPAEPWKCPDCGEPAVWTEGVDQTNDAGYSTTFKLHAERKTETCEHCGATRITEVERYCVPSNHGHRINRHVALLVPLAECEHEYDGDL